MGQQKIKYTRRLALAVMFILGVFIEGTPIISFPHEVGHFITATMMGGKAEILDAYQTRVSYPYSDSAFVRGAGYSTELWVFMFLILLTPRGGLRNYIGIGGITHTIYKAYGSVDLTGYPGATMIFIATLITVLGILIMTRKKAEAKLKSKVPAPRQPERYVRHTTATVFTTRRDGSVVVNEEKRQYNGKDQVIVFQNENRRRL